MIEHKACLSAWLRKEYAVLGSVQHVMFCNSVCESRAASCVSCQCNSMHVHFLKSCWSLFKFVPALLKSAGSKL